MKKIIALSVSVLFFALMLLSPAAFARPISPSFDTPEGYDEHDFQKAVAFLEQADEYGVKNGIRVSPGYLPTDPESWNVAPGVEPRFVWTEVNGVLKLESVNCPSVPGKLFGPLDLEGCTALTLVNVENSSLSSINVSGCVSLDTLLCKNNLLSSLSVDGCSSLRLINCANNQIAGLDVTDCPALRFLECRWNAIPSLDVSACPDLTVLICTDNCLKTLDLSNNPLLGPVKFLRIVDPGHQYISCFIATDPEYSSMNEYFISADCYDSCDSFGGWFTEDGRPVADHTTYVPRPGDGGSFVARYSLDGTTPGDANNDGAVDISDALTILRGAMSLISHPTTANFDVNGDGVVTLTDAMLILRRAMGLFGAA